MDTFMIFWGMRISVYHRGFWNMCTLISCKALAQPLRFTHHSVREHLRMRLAPPQGFTFQQKIGNGSQTVFQESLSTISVLFIEESLTAFSVTSRFPKAQLTTTELTKWIMHNTYMYPQPHTEIGCVTSSTHIANFQCAKLHTPRAKSQNTKLQNNIWKPVNSWLKFSSLHMLVYSYIIKKL